MKCEHCGFEREDLFAFCPQCGRQVEGVEPLAEQKPNFILQALKDKLFLAICILVSATAALQLLANSGPVLQILLTIFLWLVYAKAQKNEFDAKHLRCVSGTVYAAYVIDYVLAGVFAFLGVVFAIVFGAAASNSEIIEEFLSALSDSPELYGIMHEIVSTEELLSIAGTVFLVGFMVFAVLMVVFNIFSLGRIHKLAKSVYQSGGTERSALKHVKAAKNWLIVLAVFAILGGLGNLDGATFFSGLASLTDGAAMIISAILIGKYLEK